jgi:hypothetical protein
MRQFEITLGETRWTAGHCHKCAHLELTVVVQADRQDEAIDQIREQLCGTEHTIELDGFTAVLHVSGDDSLFTPRSVKVQEG